QVNRRWERGPFDIIGDVHGRLAQLVELLRSLGYEVELGPAGDPLRASHPDDRKMVLVETWSAPDRTAQGESALSWARPLPAGRYACAATRTRSLCVRAP